MSQTKTNFTLALCLLAFAALGCSALRTDKSSGATESPISSAANQNTASKSTAKNSGPSLFGETEKQKPAAGKGNVQGKVFYNDEPVEGIEVRLCENFSMMDTILCNGKTVTAKTDKDGIYVLADAEPLEYKGVMAKVFKSNYYVSPQESIVTPQKFLVEADKTIFAEDIHLFKDNLKIVSPKAGSKVDATNLELKWEPYQNAAYYKLNVYPEYGTIPSIVRGERIEDVSYTLDQPLKNGKYRISVAAYNSNDNKLAESPDNFKFTVTGGTNEPPTE